jgi:hypothetical protein
MRLFGGSSDLLADPTDLARLWAELNPSVKTFFQTYSAGHCTFMWGIAVDPWMNEVLRFLSS